jgi:stage V sporulation protein D (sporulation-specific penicillin-binding protein)
MQKRLLAMMLLLISIFILLFGRLFYLQVVNAKFLQQKAEEQWTRDLPINAERGVIYDRNGIALAVSYTTYDIFVRHSNVEDEGAVSKLLSNKLNLDYTKVFEKVSNSKVSESLIKMQVESSVAKELKNSGLSGIYYSENTKRYYPYGDFLTQVLGYTTIDNIGQSGLELYYNKFLQGIDGYSQVQSDIRGTELYNTLDSYVPSIAGNNITLTIDYQIQLLCEQAAVKIMQEQKPVSAQVIVMNPNTGEILAMTSKPSFDLNDPPRDNIETLMANSKNLSIVDVYEPGSTFKILTTASALEEKVTSLSDRFYDPGYRIVDGQKIKCWKHIGHGSQTLVDGLNNSCNSVFIDLSLRLGLNRMYKYFEKYGFGTLSNVDFAGESAGILMDKDSVKTVDLARMGFGQAIAVTPLQEINAISSVVNGGILYQPYFVSKISSSSGTFEKEFSPVAVRRTVSEDTSEKMQYMIEQVIKNANAIQSFIPGYRVGGKTGTTELMSTTGKTGEHIASFIGTFPANKPDYVILVVVDRPSSGHYYGSIVATPYAKTVFEGIIRYKNIPPTEDLDADLKTMEKNIEMPNLVGKSLSQAVGIIKNLGLQYELEGEGGKVLAQYPAPHEMLYKNGIVVLTT